MSHGGRIPYDQELEARITELEAERDELTRLRNAAIDLHQREAGDLYKARARIAELEAAVLSEREACAKMFEAMTWHRISPAEVAAAIRARPAP